MGLNRQWDAVASSHTLEHFHEFNEYFHCSRMLLKENGLLFTAVPNLEYSFGQGYANTLNPEHTAVLTLAHLLLLHAQNGYVVEQVDYFRDHTLYVTARKSMITPCAVSMASLSELLIQNFSGRLEQKRRCIELQARPDKDNWLFGASNLAQMLFAVHVKESAFKGLLDNSKLKQGKRLYGTGLRVSSPEELRGKPARIFINAAAYNTEIRQQLEAQGQPWELILL